MTITFGVSEEHLTLASNNESYLAEYCDERVCLSVRENISGTVCPISTNFFARYLWPWLCPVLSGLRYVLPYLWMTSCLQIIGHIDRYR